MQQTKNVKEYIYGIIRANDPKVTIPFLVYHPHYISSKKLFSLVSEEVKRGSGTSLQFLIEWVNYRYRDFRKSKLREEICRLALYRNNTDERYDLNRLKVGLLSAHARHKKASMPKSIPSPENRITALMKADPLAIAMQMRYVNTLLFVRLRLTDIRKGSAFTERCSNITSWAASCILAQFSYEKQTTVAKKIIGIANFSKELGDYASLWSLMQGFFHNSVNRIKAKWKLKGDLEALAGHLIEIVEVSDNHKNYRKEIESCIKNGKVCIPHLYIYQKDLTLIEEGNPYFLPSGELNQNKLEMLGSITLNIKCLQDRAKKSVLEVMKDNPPVYDYVLELPHMSDEKLDIRSAEIKPKVSALGVNINNGSLSNISETGSHTDVSLISSRDRRSASTDDSAYLDIT